MNRHPHRSLIAPIFAWSTIGIIPLLLAAARVPLWARPTQPLENYAMPLTLAALIAGSAMLFPWLMPNLRVSVFVILVAGLLVQLAGMLGGQPLEIVVNGIIATWIWLIALALWRSALPTPRAELIGVTVATSLAVGGACLAYLWMEFSAAAEIPLQTATGILLTALLSSGICATLLTRRGRIYGTPHERNDVQSPHIV